MNTDIEKGQAENLPHKRNPKEAYMKKIRNKTYANFMYVLKQIEAKGYDRTEAEKITNGLFANLNPDGKSMERMIDEVLTYAEWTQEIHNMEENHGYH